MTAAEAKQTWTDRYRRDPDLAQSIVENLHRSIMEDNARIDKLECVLDLLKMKLKEAEAKAARWAAWAAILEVQMRREGWTQEDLDELQRG